MKRLLNDQWEFVKTPIGATVQEAKAAAWTAFDLPHDWLIAQYENLYEDSEGWYRRALDAENHDKLLMLEFDGVYMDSEALMNGKRAATHVYGYTVFRVALTPLLKKGQNEMIVHARHQAPNSRWYSGAGIFRDVYLLTLPKRHFVPDADYVTARYDVSSGDGLLTAHCEMENVPDGEKATFCLFSPQGKILVKKNEKIFNNSTDFAYTLHNAAPWSPNLPNLYTLEILLDNDEIIRRRIGFRTVKLTPDKGFF